MFYSPPVAACCPRLVSSPLGLAWPGQPVSCSLPSKLGFFTTGIPTGSICAKSVWSCDLKLEPWNYWLSSKSVCAERLPVNWSWSVKRKQEYFNQITGNWFFSLMIVMRLCGQRVIDSQYFFYLFCLSLSNVLMENYYTNTCTLHIWRHRIPSRAPPWKLEKGLKRGEGQPPLAAACLCLISIKCHRHRWDEQNPGWFDDDEWTRAYRERMLMLKSEVFLFYLKNWHFLKLTDGVVMWGLKTGMHMQK